MNFRRHRQWPKSSLSNSWRKLHPNFAKAGGIQRQGVKGEAVALYCDPLVTPDLDFFGFPVRVKK
jgi:hypothetical protein